VPFFRRPSETFWAVVAAIVVAAWIRATPSQLAPSSVVLITLDTTRADRLAAYGGRSGVTPTIDAWAREGVVFDDASTVAPLTLPAHASLLTGQLPPATGIRDNTGLLPAKTPTIASALHAAGYRTAAFVSSVILDRGRGLTEGFDTYEGVERPDAYRPRRPASETVDHAITWLTGNSGQPFFLWIHLYDAHAPIELDAARRAAYAGDAYEGALAMMDAELARVRTALETTGAAKHTAVILAADHGEGLGDHDEDGHGIFVYQDVMRVPLIVHWPGARPGRVKTPVQLIDVMPMILAVDAPAAADAGGRDLEPLIYGRQVPDRAIYLESMYPRVLGWSPLRSLRVGSLKVIEAPRPELYDLSTDPHETTNLVRDRPDEAEAMLARLRGWSLGNITSVNDHALAARQLASLGYMSGALSTASQATPSAPDPKDMIGLYNRIEARRQGSSVSVSQTARR
jgi:arylsulfatase A-like enzyme